MKKRYTVKPAKSLRENLKLVIPQIFDNFWSQRSMVAGHPRSKDKLHQMRIDGKPLRYIMEIALDAFGVSFRKCYDEYKDTIELLGDIHDADVVLAELTSHLRVVRDYNRTLPVPKERLSTRGLRSMSRHYSERRKEDFAKFSDRVKKWEDEDYRSKLIGSMEEQVTP